MTYNYRLENFLMKPISNDKRIFIYDKNDNFVDSIITDLSHWFVKNNCLVIKITNKNDLILSFETHLIAQQAADKLESYRKELMILTGEIVSKDNRPTFNTLNINMMCLDIVSGVDYQLSCSTPVLQIPRSRIKVNVNNGGYVQAGVPDGIHVGCYFTSSDDNGDPIKAGVNDGDVQVGDLLYWIGSVAGFDLDSTDYLDYEYLI